jgi:site-specific recombinase XerC
MTDALEEWILQYNSGMAWFNKLDAVNTKRAYLPNLKKYCDAVKKNPDELIQLKIEGLQAINTPKEFQAENLLETFISTAKIPLSVKDSIRTTVISFYKNNRRPLLEIKEVSTPESKQRCPKTQDILDLENAFFSLRDKALLWFIASAPFRLETITKLKWKDLKPTNDKDVPYSMLIEAERLKGSGKGKYKGVKQVGFLHSLTSQKLEAYKKELERKGYMTSENDPIFIAYRKERKIKALSTFSIEGNFGKASLRAWHDLEKKRFSPHDFRSFVQSALENAGINPNMIAPILGHKPRGIDFHYSEHDIEELMQKYKTALPYLLPQSVEKLKAEVEETKMEYEEKIAKQQEKLEKQERTIEYMEKKVETLFGDVFDAVGASLKEQGIPFKREKYAKGKEPKEDPQLMKQIEKKSSKK